MIATRARRGEPKQLRRVLAVASHPIQYQAPWFRALGDTGVIDFSVLFIQTPDALQQGKGFGIAFEWDVPLLSGYRWQLASDVSGRGGFHGFFSARIGHPLRLLRELNPDAVLITGWHVWPLVQMLAAAWWAGVPIVMRGESNALRKRPWYVRALHRLLLGRCAAFLPIGRASRAFYRDYGIPEQRLFDTPYFVDNARFTAAAASFDAQRSKLRERWSIPQDSICYCYAGKLEPKKRLLDLLNALRIAASDSSLRLHLLVVGTGELMDQAQSLAAQFKLPVTFAGFLNQTEIPSAYVAADCLVLPSDFGETWGLVVNEAMACGRAAVVSDRVGCAPDLVTHGQTGAVFPFGNIDALALALKDLAKDPARLSAMGEAARARVLESYTIEKSVQGTLQAVDCVLGPA